MTFTLDILISLFIHMKYMQVCLDRTLAKLLCKMISLNLFSFVKSCKLKCADRYISRAENKGENSAAFKKAKVNFINSIT